MLEIFEILIAIISIVIICARFCKRSIKKAILLSLLVVCSLSVAFFCTIAFKNPKIELEERIKVEVKNEANLTIPKTIYMFKDITNAVNIIGEIDYNTVGTYEIKYEIPMLFSKYIKMQTVEVVDTTPPEIILEGEEKITKSYEKEYQELGYSAIDNYDGDITNQVVVEKTQIADNELRINYTVTDSSGNNATKVREVIYIDDIPPTITLNGNSKISVIIGNEYKELGAKATDNKDRRFNKQNKNRGFCRYK